VIDVGRPRRRRFTLLALIIVAVLAPPCSPPGVRGARFGTSASHPSSGARWHRSGLFGAFAGATLLVLGGGFWLIRPRRLAGRTVVVNGQPVTFSLGPIVTIASWSVAVLAAVVSGSTMMEAWTTFGLYWNRPLAAASAVGAVVDPIFGRPVDFYLFTLPVLQLLTTWASTLVMILLVAAIVVLMVTEGEQILTMRRMPAGAPRPFGPVSIVLSASWSARVLVLTGRADALFAEHTVFSA
jgi:hypothetical protein